MENTTTAKRYAKALQERRVVIVGTKFTRNGWTQFRVFIIPKGLKDGSEALCDVIVPEASYYNGRTRSYNCSAWGTDRRLEVILSIGYALGLSFSDMSQRYIWTQDTY